MTVGSLEMLRFCVVTVLHEHELEDASSCEAWNVLLEQFQDGGCGWLSALHCEQVEGSQSELS